MLAQGSHLKLDLGCGPNKREGFIGVDSLPFDGKVDVVMDLRPPLIPPCKSNRGHLWDQTVECRFCGLLVPPKNHWPWDDNSVDEVHCSHFLEHLTGAERIHFFNELHRVMKPGAKALIITPHHSSGRAYGDLTHQWPPVVEMFWYYLDKTWRAQNAPHVGFTCDFQTTWGYSIGHPWNLKTPEAQMFGVNHYREVAQDMTATITKR